ncbi:MAG TPA: GtrA family protein [Clostridiales bacterium]|nr:GtrA family protein [Clostridiales bacterium]
MEKEKKQELIRTLKFALFSVSAGVIQILSYTLMVEVFHWDNDHKLTWLSNLISLILSVIWNFTFNRKFTFKSAANVPIAMLKVAAFYAVFSPVSALCTKFLSGKGWNEYLIEAIFMVLNLVLEYFYQRFFVFKGSIDTAEKHHDEPQEEPADKEEPAELATAENTNETDMEEK